MGRVLCKLEKTFQAGENLSISSHSFEDLIKVPHFKPQWTEQMANSYTKIKSISLLSLLAFDSE